MKEQLQRIDLEIEKELELRKKIFIHNKDSDALIRDSSVLNSDTLKMINLKNTGAAKIQGVTGLGGRVTTRILEKKASEKEYQVEDDYLQPI